MGHTDKIRQALEKGEGKSEALEALGALSAKAQAQKFQATVMLMWLDELCGLVKTGYDRPSMPDFDTLLKIVGDWEEGK